MIIISEEAFQRIGNAAIVLLAIAAVVALIIWAASKGDKK